MKLVAADPPSYEFGEWESATTIPGLELTPGDRALAQSLAEGDQRLAVDELRDGIRIRPTSWIGVVRFEHFEIRIVPKLVGGNLGVLEMLDYASGLEALARFPAVRELAVARDGGLVDLLGMLLAEACERLIRDGLLQDYVTHEETLGTVRGRLLPALQVQRHFGRVDRLECRFDELESDVIENRLVAFGLGLARRVCRDEDVRRRLVRVHGIFTEACTTDGFDPAEAAEQLTYHRRNSHYRAAHEVAWYFIRRLAIADMFAPGGGRSFAFLFDMNLLFERFVSRVLDDAFAGSGVRVLRQRRDRSLLFDELAWRPYAAVIPDVLLELSDPAGRRRLPVDAKYKLYDERKIDSGDVYQTFFYAYGYARQIDRDTGRTEALIVYPSSTGGPGARLSVRPDAGVSAARIRALPLDVEAALNVIRTSGVAPFPALDAVRPELNLPGSSSR